MKMIESSFVTRQDKHELTVYSKDGCPYCSQVVKVLDLAQFNYVEYKLNKHFDKEGFYEEFGKGSTFPQVVLDGEKLGGCTETVKYLKENQLLGSR